MTSGLFELAVVVVLAAGLGVLARFLRQPVILAYLATGVVVGYFNFFNISDPSQQETFRVFSDLGIMFLLFLIGLEINYNSLRTVGRISLIVGLGQIIFTALIGAGLAWLFGYALVPALYIAVALTFSSTIIVVKLLSEKRDLTALYGKISIGMLLVQDIVAILLLVFLSSFDKPGTNSIWFGLLLTLVKAASLFALMLWVGKRVLPPIFDRAARSEELLFLLSLAWVFILATVVSRIGFSIEIAGFLAGLALANSLENIEIAGRIRPLRDFFILIFFVILGSTFVTADFSGLLWPIVVFSLFVLIGNPAVVILIMGFLGYRRRTAFLTGMTMAQISEFSLVLAALGLKLGHIDQGVVSLVTGVGIVTITLSTYLIMYAEALFPRFSRLLAVFERDITAEDGLFTTEMHRPIILVGVHRTGQAIAMNLPREQTLAVDYDPEVIAELKRLGYACLLGDIADQEIFEKVNFPAARLVISTSPDFDDNMGLLQRLRHLPTRPKVIVRAEDEKDAKLLYAGGADYVVLPNFTAGQYLGKTIALDPDLRILENMKKRDLALLRDKKRFLIA
ncbi:MAG TPA: cation:proton antiporter [Candidatus Paceibacterota bacterium]|nr:cation:proton antiporter [Candidatus Paceibacterota bacterium]